MRGAQRAPWAQRVPGPALPPSLIGPSPGWAGQGRSSAPEARLSPRTPGRPWDPSPGPAPHLADLHGEQQQAAGVQARAVALQEVAQAAAGQVFHDQAQALTAWSQAGWGGRSAAQTRPSGLGALQANSWL